MSKIKNRIYSNNKDQEKKINIFRNGFNIYSSNSFNKNNKEEKNNSFPSIEPILFEKKYNIQKNNNVLNGISNRYNNQSFNKKKYNYNYYKFNPNPNIEEIPTFTYENDLNLNSYKQQINKNNQCIENNYNNYMNYIKKFEKNERKTPLISPYSQYIKKIKDVNKYSDNTSLTSREKEINTLSEYENKNKISNHISHLNNYIKNNSNDLIYNNFINYKKIEKNMPISNSLKNINYYGRKNEISNPELFYKRSDLNYYRYREEQRKFGDYNYNIVLNKNKSRFIKKVPDINPFNPKIDLYKIGKSSLSHNIILKPEEFYGYFKDSF